MAQPATKQSLQLQAHEHEIGANHNMLPETSSEEAPSCETSTRNKNNKRDRNNTENETDHNAKTARYSCVANGTEQINQTVPKATNESVTLSETLEEIERLKIQLSKLNRKKTVNTENIETTSETRDSRELMDVDRESTNIANDISCSNGGFYLQVGNIRSHVPTITSTNQVEITSKQIMEEAKEGLQGCNNVTPSDNNDKFNAESGPNIETQKETVTRQRYENELQNEDKNKEVSADNNKEDKQIKERKKKTEETLIALLTSMKEVVEKQQIQMEAYMKQVIETARRTRVMSAAAVIPQSMQRHQNTDELSHNYGKTNHYKIHCGTTWEGANNNEQQRLPKTISLAAISQDNTQRTEMGQQQKPRGPCHGCGKIGHFISECWNKKPYSTNNERINNATGCHNCGKDNHKIAECWSKGGGAHKINTNKQFWINNNRGGNERGGYPRGTSQQDSYGERNKFWGQQYGGYHRQGGRFGSDHQHSNGERQQYGQQKEAAAINNDHDNTVTQETGNIE
jgi:hypothetical protein